MRSLAKLSVLIAAVCCTLECRAPAGELNVPPKGFTAIFNGTNLDGWYGHGTKDPRTLWAMAPEELAAHKAKTHEELKKHWRCENGELVNDGHGLYATTYKDYGDFELLLEYATVPKADSGIYLRGIPQVQIWDYTKEGGKWSIGADKGSGGLWNNPKGAPGKDPLVLADKPFGEWNAFRIVMVGERVTVFLNGKLVVDHAPLHNYFNRAGRAFPKGPIQLQTHGGEIRWRNIFIREIAPAEANDILRAGGIGKKPDAGFTSIFNGVDFSGWLGPVIRNSVKDGAILSSHGTIYTTETYGDFIMRLEFKLPAGGNNGLAIRYPGSGDAAYAGLCELQILDNTHPTYKDLDPRQFHGSAYSMAAAHRGYLRPVGQWNYQEVTVKGFAITVELNGTRILDTDISTLDPTNFMKEPGQYRGLNRTSGYVGFAGYGMPVHFRKIQIKRLN